VTDVVELRIPVAADLVVLARYAASTVASRCNFDIEEVEDLRLAVDELCVLMLHDQTDGSLELRFTWDEAEVEVSCRYEPPPGNPLAGPSTAQTDGLSERILEALVDEHGTRSEAGGTAAWLRKRRVRQDS
jgi:hypothetical protein